MIKLDLADLIAAGFQQTGIWTCDQSGLVICRGELPTEPGVYAFVVGGVVQYVGSAQRSLASRMKKYERRQRDRKSNRPIHGELTQAIAGDLPVEVYTLVIKEPLRLGSDKLPIDHAIGLEAGLIRAIDPAWNRRGRTRVLDEIET